MLYFFPLQLLILHLKRNHFLLLVWAFLFGTIAGGIGEKFGLPDLFLYPEYLGEVDFWSYAVLGFSVGGFTMAFHIHSYIAHSRKFPFIATLSRPFLKFSINNSLLPNLFALVHLIQILKYQSSVEMEDSGTVLLHGAGYVFGGGVFLLISFFYFFRTNVDLNKVLQKAEEKKKIERSRFGKKTKWYQPRQEGAWHIETYMAIPLTVRLARGSEHYEDVLLQKVFAQNHLNASLFELIVIASFILLGSFREIAFFMVPAGASIFLLFTMILMIASAIHSWVKGWSLSLILGLFLLFNFLSTSTEWFRVETRAYGMNYQKAPVPYSADSLKKWRKDTSRILEDRLRTLKMLENWKEKRERAGDSLPKMVFLNVSGGGLRSALWTVHVLQCLDSLTHGSIMDRTPLITGSSGGMLGAAYLREHHLRRKKNPHHPFRADVYKKRIAKDLLNRMAFSIATNDLFIRYQTHRYNGRTYKKDRAYAFEQRLNANTKGILDKPLQAYAQPVQKARIPMMIFSPSVANDGRRLLISSLPVSYLMQNLPDKGTRNDPMVEDIAFHRMFGDHGSRELRFLSALRMNASFPYIFPTTSLPSKPRMDVMDAGLRDNFGFRTSINFLYRFRSWIRTNTSGVIFLQLRDKEREAKPDPASGNSLFKRMTRPVGSLYENVFRIQDHEQNRISLSLHLTSLEKRRITNAIKEAANQRAVTRLKDLLRKGQP
ncbi:MAG: patatin-like phospholipase family protein [Flavobacteriales bacterium]